jgi:hypothetical protein
MHSVTSAANLKYEEIISSKQKVLLTNYFQIILVLKLFKIFLSSIHITHYSAVHMKAEIYSCLRWSSITAVVTISPAK